MTRLREVRRFLPPLLALLLLGAAAAGPDPETLLRQGDAAFARGDLPGAATLYARALERAPDPGPAAFNLAATRYRLAVDGPVEHQARELHEAEGLYRGLADGPGPRRAAALFGLGNCLLVRAAAGDVAALNEARRCYRRCLAEPDLDAALADDVRHNLERARLLALQLDAPPESAQAQQGDENPNPREKPPEEKGRDGQQPQPDLKGPRPAQKAGPQVVKAEDRGQAQVTDQQRPGGRSVADPGSGDAPPPAADVAEAARRIEEEARAFRRRKVPAAAGVRDW
jgi:hypothetical protein